MTSLTAQTYRADRPLDRQDGDMTEATDRSVHIERIGLHKFRATNARGGTVDFGDGGDPTFSPVDLLLTAIAGCTALDVEYITGKRAEPSRFDAQVSARKV